jgi:lipopolysaccharide biosynthesis glycosyltransferase
MLRLVTIVTPDFWPGFAALVQSLTENCGTEFELYPICDENHLPHQWLEERSERISPLPISSLPRIRLLSSQRQGRRMENALQKLAIFALPKELGKCIYIDSDIVCLKDMRALESAEPFSLAPDVAMMSERVPADPLNDPDFEFNTGLMVFRPDPVVFEELKSVYHERHHERTHKGDQDIFNLWVRGRRISVTCLGSEWNFAKRYQDFLGAKRCKALLPRIKLLHFVGVKPWTPNSEINTFRECHYRWMEEIWWDYFDRSGFARYMSSPPLRSTAFKRQWILPWAKPAILREHMHRVWRFVRRRLAHGTRYQ